MELQKLAFEVARAQLASQKEDLRHARSQAGMAAAMSGLIATVFASLIDPSTLIAKGMVQFLGIPLELWLVFITFVPSVYCAAMVGISHRTCTFDLNPNWILGQVNRGASLEQTFSALAKDCDRYFDGNETVISEARNFLWWSVVFGCAQIPAWIVVLV